MFKKMMIFTLLAVITFLACQQNIHVNAIDISDIDNENQYEEKIYLESGFDSDPDFLFNGVLSDRTQMDLTEGVTAEVTYLLSNVLSKIDPREGFEVQSITLVMNLSLTLTTENVVVQTTDPELVKDVIIFGDYTGVQYFYNIDIDGYESVTEHVSEFSYTIDPGGEGTARIGSTFLKVLYTKSLDEYNTVIECGSDYTLLPDTNENFVDIISMEVYNENTHSYKLSLAYGTNIYFLNIAVPDEVYDHVYSSSWDERIYFTEIGADQMSLATSPDGEQILYIQPDSFESNKPSILDNGEEPDIVGFITMNLTSMEYKVINKLQLMGVVNKEDSRYASLYCFFPTRIENLLSITVSYEYRINKILGFKGEWQETMNTYVRGDQYNGAPPSWQWWIPGLGWGWASASYITGDYDIYDIPDVIVPIEAADVPGEVEYKYVNELGGDKSDLYSLELYKVSLGQFQDGFFTAFSDDNAYDVQELAILDIIYEYKGVVYEASTEEIESIVSTPELSPELLDMDDDLTKAIVYIVAILGVGLIIIKLELRKNPGVAVLIVAAVIYVLYRMELL